MEHENPETFHQFCKRQRQRVNNRLFPSRCAWGDGLDNALRYTDHGTAYLPREEYDIERRQSPA